VSRSAFVRSSSRRRTIDVIVLRNTRAPTAIPKAICMERPNTAAHTVAGWSSKSFRNWRRNGQAARKEISR